METGDDAYWKTLKRCGTTWCQHQMYITGGVGSREAGEAFGEAYELPNAQLMAKAAPPSAT